MSNQQANRVPKPYFKTLPEWIYESPAYEKMRASEAFFLHLLCGQCDVLLDDGSRRGARVGEKLIEVAKIDRATAYRYLKRFRESGIVVKLEQGGGKGIANEYGVPVEKGALDHCRVPDNPIYKTRKPSHTATVIKLHPNIKPSHDATQTLAPCDTQPSHEAAQTVAPCTSNRRTMPALHTSPSSPYLKHNTSIHTSKTSEPVDKAVSSSLDDDQALRLMNLLPDDAGEDHIARVLTDQGVSRGRAVKLARQITSAQVREAISRCQGKETANPGGYLAEVVGVVIDETRAAKAQESARQAEERAALLGGMDYLIDKLVDEDLVEVIERYCERERFPTAGMTPDFIRKQNVWRRKIAQQLLIDQHEGLLVIDENGEAKFPNGYQASSSPEQ